MKWSAILFRLGIILLLVGLVPGFLLAIFNISPWMTAFLLLSCGPPAVLCLVLAGIVFAVERLRKRDVP